MNFQLKGLREEPKGKLIALGASVVVLAGVFYFSVLAPSDDERPAEAGLPERASGRHPELAGGTLRPPAPETRQRPPLKPGPGRPGQSSNSDSATSSPTPLRSILPCGDLLARVQAVSMAGGVRNLFQFGAPPLPKIPEVKINPLSVQAAAAAAATPAPGPPPTPPPPPIPLKFYGYATPAPSGAKRVFFLDGEDIIVAAEGQLVKNRYKLVRVGINSVVVEDVQFKHEQTLPLEEEKGQGQTG